MGNEAGGGGSAIGDRDGNKGGVVEHGLRPDKGGKRECSVGH